MDTEELHELFYAFWEAGIMLSFGRDCVTNIPKDSDPDDMGWHLMFRDMSPFKGQMNVFHRIVEEAGPFSEALHRLFRPLRSRFRVKSKPHFSLF